MWRRAQLVFPALNIDATTNEWTGPDKLTEENGFLCWLDKWPDRIPRWMDAHELAATAVIACPSLDRAETVQAIVFIAGVDAEVAATLLEDATTALQPS